MYTYIYICEKFETSSAIPLELERQDGYTQKSLKVSMKRCSDGRATSKRGRDRWGVERRVDTTVPVSGASFGHRRKPVDRRRAGSEKSARTDQGKVAGTDDHALTGAGQLDGSIRHRENIHCHAKR